VSLVALRVSAGTARAFNTIIALHRRPHAPVPTRTPSSRPSLLLTLFITYLACLAAATPAHAADSATVLTAAGNAPTDSARLAQLRELTARSARDPSLLDSATRTELDALLPVVAAWVEGRARATADFTRGSAAHETHRYLHDFFDKPTEKFDPVFPTPPRTSSPLYPLWAFYRGRFLVWCMLEYSNIGGVPEQKARFIAETERCFALARAAFPENAALRIYSGENIPAPHLSPVDDRAPAWANHQRRALEQLHAIIRWWIDERQLPNGEFGGKWGDDVEMWRWWAPVLIGFDDPIVNAAQEKLARGNLARPTLAAGYTSQLTDVEHTAEETADTLTPMLHALGPNPTWDPRIHKLITLANDVWWGENARGRVQFKHLDFNHERLGSDAARAYDTGYHIRVMQPALLLWQRTGDPALGRPLLRWLRTWAEAALGTDNGKPAGIVPSALRWPSGQVGSPTRGWIGPDLGADPMESIYTWPYFPARAMTAALLQAHIQTGEKIFIDPLLQMAALRRAHLKAGDPDGEPRSLAWAAHRLPLVINDSLAKWRQLTGDSSFDDLLLADANGYVQRLLGKSDAALATQLGNTARTLSHNWPMFTEEVRYTDRVLTYPQGWPGNNLPRIEHALLYSTVTGDPGAVETYPLNGVRWHTLPREIAALVTENRRDRFAAELYHFGREPRAFSASLLLLDPGRYTWILTDADGKKLSSGEFALTPTQRQLALTLPPRTPTHLTLHRL
ncbi:MAG: hypothetical protein V4773_15125, partial [Verrucomicrobiota bacterium]